MNSHARASLQLQTSRLLSHTRKQACARMHIHTFTHLCNMLRLVIVCQGCNVSFTLIPFGSQLHQHLNWRRSANKKEENKGWVGRGVFREGGGGGGWKRVESNGEKNGEKNCCTRNLKIRLYCCLCAGCHLSQNVCDAMLSYCYG